MNRPVSPSVSRHRAAPHAVRALAHVLLTPAATIAILVSTVSLLSASATTALGVPTSLGWLVPSLQWTIQHQPAWVASWMLWLMVPAATTAGLIALLHRRVRAVPLWRWMVLGGLTHAAALGGIVWLGWIAMLPPSAAAYLAAAGFVTGLVATGYVELVVRLGARLLGSARNERPSVARPASASATSVSVRPS